MARKGNARPCEGNGTVFLIVGNAFIYPYGFICLGLRGAPKKWTKYY